MNPSCHMVNYNTTHPNRVNAQGRRQDDTHRASKLHPIYRVIIQLTCYLLQVMIVICQQLEILYQRLFSSFVRIKKSLDNHEMVFYRQSGVRVNLRVRLHEGLILACRTVSLSLAIMFVCGMTWMFWQAGF